MRPQPDSGRRTPRTRRPGESKAEWEARLRAQDALIRQARDEVALAAASQGMSLTAVADKLGVHVSGLSHKKTGITVAWLADVGEAIGVEFFITSRPKDNNLP